jgi:osmotically-inducible protein OsmY
MQDGEIRDHVRDALVQETELEECKLAVLEDGGEVCVRDPVVARGDVHLRVADGVVTFDGEVPSLSHRRLAGVLAWWVPGTRDVENRLGIVPPEVDNDDEVSDAVQLALEKEPFVDADQIGVSTRAGSVHLRGMVGSEEQRQIAGRDAWYVMGVDDVVNEIVVKT